MAVSAGEKLKALEEQRRGIEFWIDSGDDCSWLIALNAALPQIRALAEAVDEIIAVAQRPNFPEGVDGEEIIRLAAGALVALDEALP